ncbi:Uncharacterised protein [Mycobacterium tuberculosis]|uniref:Uncharacterized protein n=1 Tax=Mycobacterium tuberculosis TaxID=1773 RepID=A0A655AXY7_MYCTX|nr:Uncharacterised protein [Mycobacterium tuberculosis]
MKVSWRCVNCDCTFLCFYVIHIHIRFEQLLKDCVRIFTSKYNNTFVVKEVRNRT